MGAKLLFLDIETAPILMTSWSMRPPYAGAVWVERDTFILMFSYKWAHEKQVKTVCLPDFPRYKRSKHDDKDLCRDLHSLLDEADLVCAHNGDAFDIKKINSRLIVNGFQPPSPYKTIDTLKIARRVFKFDSNKLDNIGRYLGEGRKIPNTGAALWRGCVEGDLKAWATMRRYGKQDTALLANAYERLKCWAPNHPNLNLYKAYQDRVGCPTCGSTNTQRRGVAVKKAYKYYRFQCNDCGSWFEGTRVT
ncbi:RNase_H superfamily protein [Bradyrhizobium yuanmingense]|uniref:RNase_H superfamily protein n=1 Tax=Bradyrhizobium yuanmingense TaxID=108015 RepID=A0A1C3XL14_9BRAD|nr:ribonuclease H-like domain-containing protein [Bradyrhizobium yuanmingense]TWI19005.1 RNase H superfamily protein [Bradyrhizobium yuanmingense]SCB52746.1 RNase_H superfamily protein [Bradyrhizobium yuanmingense]